MQNHENESARRTKRGTKGCFFAVHMPTVRSLIDKGMCAVDLLAYMALAAGTDAANEATRSGRKAVSRLLNGSRDAAGHSVKRLIDLGAIQSLEDSLKNQRDPTASRFRLLRLHLPPVLSEQEPAACEPAHDVFGSDWARLPNALAQDPARAISLSRAVEFGGMPVLETILQLARDPLQTEWPPEIWAVAALEPSHKLGSRPMVTLDLSFVLLPGGAVHFGERHETVILLAEFGLVHFDVYTAVARGPSKALAMFAPVATFAHGSLLLPGSFGSVALLSLLALNLMQDPNRTIPAPEVLCDELLREDKLCAVLPSGMAGACLVVRPRLAVSPGDPRSLDARQRQDTLGQSAAQEMQNLINQHFPNLVWKGNFFGPSR